MDEYLVSFAEAMVHTPVDAMECEAYYTVQLIAKLGANVHTLLFSREPRA
jgi:hypothetical protein